LVSLAAILASVCVQPAIVWARPPAMGLLPEKTAVMISVADCPDLAKRYMNTALGRMSQDPQMSPLVKQLYGSLADVVAGLRDQIGLSLPEILSIPQGEFTFALIPLEEGPEAVILLDTGTQLASARGLWLRLSQFLDKSGATKSQETIAGTTVSIYDGLGPQKRKVMFFEKDTCLVLASSLQVVRPILDAWNGSPAKTLGENPSFAAILRQCRGEKGEESQVTWYVDPVSLLKAAGQRNPGVQLAVAMLPTLGLDGLQGAGGTLAFDVGQFDEITQAHLLLENPRSGVFDVLCLAPGDSTPEPWVPNDAVRYLTFHWEFKRSFKAVQKVYDSVRGEGALATAIRRGIEDPLGVDLVNQILPSLEGRVTYVNWIERPVTIASSATLVAVKLKDATPLRKALETAASKSEGRLALQSFSGKEYYQIKAGEGPRGRSPDAPPVPRPCFGILNDYFIFTDHGSLFEKVITTNDTPADSLGAALDYRLVASKIARRTSGKKPALLGFQRPEEAMRFLYDLAVSDRTRAGLRGQAESNPFFKSLNSALEAHPLPPFEVIQRYFAPSGSAVIDDETGLHYTAFSLRRK
jgi:hypothetical protein